MSTINLLNTFSAGAVSTNPQYFFKVPDYDEKSCNVVISLMQKHAEDTQDAKHLKIGFFITMVSTVRYHVGTVVFCVAHYTCTLK